MDDEKKTNSNEEPEDGPPQDSGQKAEDANGGSEEASATSQKPATGKVEAPATEASTAKKPATEKSAVKKPAAEKAATEKTAADKPETTKPAAEEAATEKPAAAAGEKSAVKKPAVKKPPVKRPVRPRGPTYEDLEENPLLDALKERFGEAILSGQTFLDQAIYTVDLDSLYDVMLHLRDDPDCQFDYLVDLTAMDYLGEEKRFCLVYQLYSHATTALIRVKSRLEQDVFAPSVTSIWTTADWLEREVYDMFGIEFSGHPDLRRILLPEDWHGFPLRKDYDIKLQDQSWIRKHLRIRKVPG